ncbi:hypothetical protein ACJX0J_014882 [Zea mays]
MRFGHTSKHTNIEMMTYWKKPPGSSTKFEYGFLSRVFEYGFVSHVKKETKGALASAATGALQYSTMYNSFLTAHICAYVCLGLGITIPCAKFLIYLHRF